MEINIMSGWRAASILDAVKAGTNFNSSPTPTVYNKFQ